VSPKGDLYCFTGWFCPWKADNGRDRGCYAENGKTDELLQLAFALEEKAAANPRECARPAFGHFERECFHLFLLISMTPPLCI
jgi:hypothetical protein